MFSNGRLTFWLSKTDFSFLSNFARYHYRYFFVTSFCQNCNIQKHFYEWAWVSIRYFDFKCYMVVSIFRKTKHKQWARIPNGDKCLQKQHKNQFFVILDDDI